MNSNEVPISFLKPHPKNSELFPDRLPENLWRELVEDIKQNGIINPLVVTPDYTVLAGHLRLEAAREAGLTHVPVVIRDVDPESDEAVSMLIRDNLLRRHLNDVQIARLIRKLKEEYGIRRGGYREPDMEEIRKSKGHSVLLTNYEEPDMEEIGVSKGQNALLKVANMMGVSERHVKRLDKINDLIPELQELVSTGKLGAIAASELGFLSPETQRQLLAVYGEKIAELSKAEARELRKKIEAEVRAETEREISKLSSKIDELERQRREIQVAFEQRESELKRAVAELQDSLRNAVSPDELRRLQEELQAKERELAETRAKLSEMEEAYRSEVQDLKSKIKELELGKQVEPEVVEKVVEKVVPDPAQQARIQELEREISELRKRLESGDAQESVKDALVSEIERLKAEKRVLEREVNRLRSPSLFASRMRKLMLALEREEEELAELATQVNISETHYIEAQRWLNTLERFKDIIRTALGPAAQGRVINVIPIRRDEG
ncbi:MAG: ParB N-terminal domain-containing protein [Thermacetogeniaceae bacterium]